MRVEIEMWEWDGRTDGRAGRDNRDFPKLRCSGRPGDRGIHGKANAGCGYRIVSSVNGEGKDGGERLATSASGDSSNGCDSLHGVHDVCGREERAATHCGRVI